MQFFVEKTFERVNAPEKGEYELCVFKSCDLSNADLSGNKFIECQFVDCNLSNALIRDVILRDVSFNGCKMLGLMFNTCNSFGFSVGFNGCILNHSSFYQKKMKGTAFKNSKLQESDFTESDLTNAVFENCDLLNAAFEKTILEKTDFRTSFNYSINPDLNKIKKARFSLSGIEGLLRHIDIEIDKHS